MKPYRYDSQLLQSQTTARRLLLNLSGLLLFHTNQMKKKTESNNRLQDWDTLLPKQMDKCQDHLLMKSHSLAESPDKPHLWRKFAIRKKAARPQIRN